MSFLHISFIYLSTNSVTLFTHSLLIRGHGRLVEPMLVEKKKKVKLREQTAGPRQGKQTQKHTHTSHHSHNRQFTDLHVVVVGNS